MPAPELTDEQHELLRALVDRHAEIRRPVKRDRIAATVKRHPVTVSVRMQALRALGLVESTSGPKGGYEPTLQAYSALVTPEEDRVVCVPVAIGDAPARDLPVRDLVVMNAQDSTRSRAELVLDELSTEFGVGDRVRIGPLSLSTLCLEGIVTEIDAGTNTVVLGIETIHTTAEDIRDSTTENESPTCSH